MLYNISRLFAEYDGNSTNPYAVLLFYGIVYIIYVALYCILAFSKLKRRRKVYCQPDPPNSIEAFSWR
jgi:hypothetical protein